MGLLTVEKVRYNDGMKNAVMDINVGDTSDLPALGAVIFGLKIMATSFACDKSGTFYKLHNDGEWYICDGSGNTASESSLNASLNASLSAPKTSAQLGEGKSVLVQDEPEINLDGGFEREEQPVKEQKKVFEESIEEPEKDGEDDAELL
jgi:hypothetical protein